MSLACLRKKNKVNLYAERGQIVEARIQGLDFILEVRGSNPTALSRALYEEQTIAECG